MARRRGDEEGAGNSGPVRVGSEDFDRPFTHVIHCRVSVTPQLQLGRHGPLAGQDCDIPESIVAIPDVDVVRSDVVSDRCR